jgi:streptogramin lyase
MAKKLITFDAVPAPFWQWIQLGLLALGGISAGLAIWSFYFSPWLELTSPFDTWLADTSCYVAAWCTAEFNLPDQPAILAVLLSVLFFALALRRPGHRWPVDNSPALPLAWPVAIRLRRVIGASLLAGLAAIIIAGYQALSGVAPWPLLWLAGIGACLLAATLWDWQQPLELLRTLANLVVAVGMLLVILGVACLPVAKLISGLVLLIAGGLTFSLGSRWTARLGSSLRPLEHVTMLGLALVALLLTMSQVWSWRFAFIGDEWVFFETARTINHQPGTFDLLAMRDTAGYHTILSFSAQAWVMRLVGETVYGWRLASSLPFVLSIPPIYVFIRWLAGRGAAFLGAGLLASAHVLQTFSMAAYNNSQALLPLTLGLGLFAFAAVRASLLRYLLLGLAVGLGLYTYGLARLVVLPLGVLLLTYFWPLRRGYLPGWGPVTLGGLAAATPILLNLGNWQALQKATPLQSEVTGQGVGVGLQMLHNAVLGSLAFLTNHHNTHFIAGPYADPLTALLVLLGLGLVLGSLARTKRAWVWLLASGLFVLAVSSIQQYGFVSPTRMFILPPIYAIYAGLGGAALVQFLFPRDPSARSALLGMLVAAAAGFNLFHVERVSLSNSRWTVETILMQQIQATAAPDRGGMPVFVIMEQHRGLRMNLIATGYDVGRERLVFLTPEEAHTLPHLCRVASEPAMVLVDLRAGPVDPIRERLAGCWPNYRETKIYNRDGEVTLYRFLTESGQHELARRQRDRQSSRQEPDTLALLDPGDTVVDSDGIVYALSPDQAKIYRFGADGQPYGAFSVDQEHPSALAITADRFLLVASPHDEKRLVWYDAAGRMVGQIQPDLDVGSPRGLAVRSNGEILVADEAGGRVVRLSASRAFVSGEYTGEGKIGRPFSVAASPDGTVWVVDADGQLLHLSPFDELLASYPLPPTSIDRMRRIVPTANGDLLLTEPDGKRVLRLGPQGQPLRVWNGFDRPVAAATTADGRLFIADWGLDQIAILPPITAALGPTVAVQNISPVSATEAVERTLTFEAERAAWDTLPPPTLEISPADGLTLFTSPDPDGLDQPRGIAVGPNGRVYVADTGNRRLLILDEKGAFINQVNGGSTPFEEPVDLAIDSKGHVYVADAGQGRLSVFSPEGTYLLDVPIESVYLSRSRGIFIDQLDRIWIANTSQSRLVGSDLAGNVFIEFGLGSEAGTQPIDVAVGLDGDIFASDGILHQLLHFDAQGNLQDRWDLPAPNTAMGPHLALDSRGVLYVTNPQEGLVHRFSPSGQNLAVWPLVRPDGSPMRPVGLDLDAQDRLWLVDSEGDSIVRLDIGPGEN